MNKAFILNAHQYYDFSTGKLNEEIIHRMEANLKSKGYTIIRPEWLNDRDEIDYGTTQKGEPFKNPKATVSRKSVADLVVKLATTPELEIRKSLGVHKTL